MYVLIELLKQKNTSLQVNLYQERPKNFPQIKYLISWINDKDDNKNFSFQTLLTFFSSFLKVQK